PPPQFGCVATGDVPPHEALVPLRFGRPLRATSRASGFASPSPAACGSSMIVCTCPPENGGQVHTMTAPGCPMRRFEPAPSGTYPVTAEDRWMPSLATAEGSGRDREIPGPDIPRR